MIEITRWERPTLQKWAKEMNVFERPGDLARLFESQLNELTRGLNSARQWTPSVDIYEDANNVLVKAEVPGLKKEEIEVSLEDDVLSLSGVRKSATNLPEAKAHRLERFAGRFQRTINLPAPVKSDQVSANYQDGILTVTLPKAEAAKPKQIKVEGN